MERNAEAEKAGPENEAADTKNRFPTFERSEPTIFPAQTPWGWKESSTEDGWGIWGLQTRLFL
jgi:hypothetical protein